MSSDKCYHQFGAWWAKCITSCKSCWPFENIEVYSCYQHDRVVFFQLTSEFLKWMNGQHFCYKFDFTSVALLKNWEKEQILEQFTLKRFKCIVFVQDLCVRDIAPFLLLQFPCFNGTNNTKSYIFGLILLGFDSDKWPEIYGPRNGGWSLRYYH